MTRNIPVGAVGELAPGKRKLIFVDGRSIVLFNVDDTIYAIDDSCPHNGASLAGGKLEGSVLHCPAHGMRFDLRTGHPPGARELSLTTFPVRCVDGRLVLSLEDPGADCPNPRPCSTAPAETTSHSGERGCQV